MGCTRTVGSVESLISHFWKMVLFSRLPSPHMNHWKHRWTYYAIVMICLFGIAIGRVFLLPTCIGQALFIVSVILLLHWIVIGILFGYNLPYNPVLRPYCIACISVIFVCWMGCLVGGIVLLSIGRGECLGIDFLTTSLAILVMEMVIGIGRWIFIYQTTSDTIESIK